MIIIIVSVLYKKLRACVKKYFNKLLSVSRKTTCLHILDTKIINPFR